MSMSIRVLRRVSQRKILPEKKREKRTSSRRKERKDTSLRKEKKREEIYKEEKKTKDPPLLGKKEEEPSLREGRKKRVLLKENPLRCTPKPIEHARAREGHKGEEGSASSPRPSSPRWARHGERSLRSLRGSSPTRPRILLGSRFASRRTIGPFSFSFWALSAKRRLPGGGIGLRRSASCGARVAQERKKGSG